MSLLSVAHASATHGPGEGALGLMNFLPIVLVFIVMYVLLIRPQSKRQKEHRLMIDQLKRGDRVVTAGGLIGVVSRIQNDSEVLLELGPGIEVRVVKSTIAQVMTKGLDKKDSAPAASQKEDTAPEAKSSKTAKTLKKPFNKSKK